MDSVLVLFIVFGVSTTTDIRLCRVTGYGRGVACILYVIYRSSLLFRATLYDLELHNIDVCTLPTNKR